MLSSLKLLHEGDACAVTVQVLPLADLEEGVALGLVAAPEDLGRVHDPAPLVDGADVPIDAPLDPRHHHGQALLRAAGSMKYDAPESGRCGVRWSARRGRPAPALPSRSTARRSP